MTPQEIEAAIGTLPDKLSDLLEVALDDFEKVTRHPKFEISMSNWCVPAHGVCFACLAGGMLAHRIGVDEVIRKNIMPRHHVSESLRSKMLAINALREGSVAEAAFALGIQIDDKEWPNLTIYHSDGSEGFIPEMRSLIALLRTHHL